MQRSDVRRVASGSFRRSLRKLSSSCCGASTLLLLPTMNKPGSLDSLVLKKSLLVTVWTESTDPAVASDIRKRAYEERRLVRNVGKLLSFLSAGAAVTTHVAYHRQCVIAWSINMGFNLLFISYY